MSPTAHLHTPWLATTLIATLAALTVTACGRDDNRSAGQKLDSGIAKVEQKAGEIKAEARDDAAKAQASTEAAANKAGQAINQTMDKVATQVGSAAEVVADKVADASITTRVNAELAKDSTLSALRINVDTVNGRVLLRGSAPSTLARDRATTLAQQVKGVNAVDNQLDVRG